MNRIKFILGMVLLIVVTLLGIFVGDFSKANPIPQAYAQACTPPSQVQGVRVDYPNCVGSQCSFAQASCSWSTVAGATKYQLTVTEVESGSVVVNEQPDANATSKVFSVTQNKTYKCDVAAINSCGATGTSGSFSLLCEVDAAVTVNPTAPPAATVPPAAPTVPPTGMMSNTMMVVFGSIVVFVIGISLFVL